MSLLRVFFRVFFLCNPLVRDLGIGYELHGIPGKIQSFKFSLKDCKNILELYGLL